MVVVDDVLVGVVWIVDVCEVVFGGFDGVGLCVEGFDIVGKCFEEVGYGEEE